MKQSLLSIALCLPALTLAENAQPTIYPIEEFSDNYRGEVSVITQDDNREYTLTITDKNNKPVIKISPYAGFSEFDLNDKGEIKSNVAKPPYDEQNLIISQDVDFDGVADLAVRNGFNSCYGGPSYDIYLQQGEKLEYSPEFSRLAQDYCGMFRVNHETKTLHTMTKSGAAWHQYTDFSIEDGKPVAVKIVEEAMQSDGIAIWHYKEQHRVNGKMVEKNYRQLPNNDDLQADSVFSFVLENGKKIYLFKGDNEKTDKLHFVLTDENNYIELYYDNDFFYQKSSQELIFLIDKTAYTLSSDAIIVVVPDEASTVLKAVPNSATGKISRVTDFTNVSILRKRLIQYNPLPEKQ